jgi:hypothetical protein
MKKEKIMKKFIIAIITVTLLTSCTEDFLNNPPTTGLSTDKLIDLPAMEALIYGAYGQVRSFVHQPVLYGTALSRDVLIRERAEYDQFYDHLLTTSMTGWMFSQGYSSLGTLNTVSESDLENMNGTDEEKNAILGDKHFLRAYIYFNLNNYFALPSTGYSVPLLLEPLGVNDSAECASTAAVIERIEEDIELARNYFSEVSGEADYYAATALAARIYFFHEKYDLAYERANEVIESGKFELETNPADAFVPGASSKEILFTIKYNASDGSGTSPSLRMFEAYRPEQSQGFYSLNPDSEVAALWSADTADLRYKSFFTETPQLTYIDGKYTTDQMDFIVIRLAEVYLTRAEAAIMNNNSVSQADVDDMNMIIGRGNPGNVLTGIPALQDALDLLYEERLKELAFETDDHYLNVRRLKKPIIQSPTEGGGWKNYEEYSDLLVFPFPETEVGFHNLTRNP